MADFVVDMTQGVYRRIYGGFVNGKKICSVSEVAEAWFWRLLVSADDFGNLRAQPELLAPMLGGRRRVPVEESERRVAELAQVGLIQLYTVDDERFIHIVGFTERQPAPRNGKRIKRVPGNPGESRCVQIIPGELRASDSDSDSDSEDHSQHGGVRSHPPEPNAIRPGDRTVALANGTPPAPYGLTHNWGAIREILANYPASGRSGPRRAYEAIDGAIGLISIRESISPDDAAAWLLGRVRAYAESPAGKRGKFTPKASRWFAEGMYDDPPEAWAMTRPDNDGDGVVVGERPLEETAEQIGKRLDAVKAKWRSK